MLDESLNPYFLNLLNLTPTAMSDSNLHTHFVTTQGEADLSKDKIIFFLIKWHKPIYFEEMNFYNILSKEKRFQL